MVKKEKNNHSKIYLLMTLFVLEAVVFFSFTLLFNKNTERFRKRLDVYKLNSVFVKNKKISSEVATDLISSSFHLSGKYCFFMSDLAPHYLECRTDGFCDEWYVEEQYGRKDLPCYVTYKVEGNTLEAWIKSSQNSISVQQSFKILRVDMNGKIKAFYSDSRIYLDQCS